MEVPVDNDLRLFHLVGQLVNEDCWDVTILAFGALLEEVDLEPGVPVERIEKLFDFNFLVKDFILRVIVLL